MKAKKLTWILINLLGGLAVIASYLWGFIRIPGAAGVLWGGVPQGMRPFYTLGMFLAAGGYLVFSFYLLRKPAEAVRFAGFSGFGIFNLVYVLILIPSALWLPLSLLAHASPSPLMLWLVRADLAVVALVSLALLAAGFTLQPVPTHRTRLLLVLSGLAFCFQTVILDAILWSASFGS